MKWTVKWTKKTCSVPNCYSAIYLDIRLIGNQERLVSFFQYQTFFDAAFHGSFKKQKFSFLCELLVVSGNLASPKMTPRIFTKRSMPLALILICSMWNKSTLSCSCNVGKFTLIMNSLSRCWHRYGELLYLTLFILSANTIRLSTSLTCFLR